MAGIHTEEYKVLARSEFTTPPIRLELTSLQLIDATDDNGNPVEKIVLYKGLPANGNSLTGLEWPEDNVANVYLQDSHYQNAVSQIVINTKVGYVSAKLNGVETISALSWRA